jgi:hypothetical protein
MRIQQTMLLMNELKDDLNIYVSGLQLFPE